jgi:hypothetical protein
VRAREILYSWIQTAIRPTDVQWEEV